MSPSGPDPVGRAVDPEALRRRLASLDPAARRRLAGRLVAGPRPVPPVPPDDWRPTGSVDPDGRLSLPASPGQEQMHLAHEAAPDSPAYNIPVALRIRGAWEGDEPDRVLAGLMARHDSLRTGLCREAGRVWQRIHPVSADARCAVPWVAGGPPGSGGGGVSVREWLEAIARAPFRMDGSLLWRAAVVRAEGEDPVLLLVFHHAVMDGMSRAVLMREFLAGWACLRGGPGPGDVGPAPSVARWAAWQAGRWEDGRDAAAMAHWRRELADVGDPPDVGLLAPPVRAVGEAARLARDWDDGRRAAVDAVASRAGVTRFTVLQAALAVVLHRCLGLPRVLTGTPVAARSRAGLAGAVGYVVNLVPLVADLSDDPTVADLLRRIHAATGRALEHAELPYHRLVRGLGRSPGSGPLITVAFQVRDEPAFDLPVPGLRLERVEVDRGRAPFDLSVAVHPVASGLRVEVERDGDRVGAPGVATLLDAWESVLDAMAADPAARVSALALVGDPTVAVLAARGRGDPVPAGDPDVVRVFLDQARRTPDALAVEGPGVAWTYAVLERRSAALAARLCRAGVRPGDRVGVLLERSPDVACAFLAILRAGAAYVPLDPSHPPERIALQRADAGIRRVIARAGAVGVPPGDGLDPDPGDGPPGEVPAGPDSAGDAAYVMYTSGTTGRPNGVEVPHRAIVRLVVGAGYVTLGPGEVLLQLAPLAFDASTFEIWGALLTGGRLVFPSPGPVGLQELRALIRDSGITTLWLTAGYFRVVVDADPGLLRPLRQLLSGGDVLPVPQVRRVLSEVPGLRLVNGYGPTENTTFTCCHAVGEPPGDGDTVPLGRPVRGTDVWVVDAHGHLVPDGFPGELWVSGAGLARGYVGNPDLTRERFVDRGRWPGAPARLYRTGDRVRWRSGGVLEFLGRMDQQLKIRGFRVEPGEVEAVLAGLEGVGAAAVVGVRGDGGEAELRAFVVPRDPDADALPERWRKELAGRLPAFLVPARIECVRELPLNPNGKVDRARLAALPREDGDGEASGAPALSTQARLWWLQMADPVRGPNHVWLGWRIRGAVDIGILREALEDLGRWHEVLRTGYRMSGAGLMQQVLASAGPGLRCADLSGLPATEREAAWEAMALGSDRECFDLEAGPVWRAHWWRLADGEGILGLLFHHVAVDEASLDLLARQLWDAYAARVEGRVPARPETGPVPRQVAMAEQRTLASPRAVEALRAWRTALDGVSPRVPFPVESMPRDPAGDGLCGRVVRRVDPEVGAALAALAREEGTTGFTVLVAALQIHLQECLGLGNFAVAFPLTLRDGPGLARAVGPLINTVPLVVRPPVGSFRQTLRAVRSELLDAYRRGFIPLDRIVRALNPVRQAGIPPWSEILIAPRTGAPDLPTVPGLVPVALDFPRARPKAGLTFMVSPEAGGWRLELEHDAGRFDAAWVGRLLEGCVRLLEEGALDPDRVRWAAEEGVREEPIPLRDGTGPAEEEGVPSEAVARVWCRHLPAARADRDEDFLRLGGDSLGAMRLLEELRHATGVEVSLADFLRCPTLGTLLAGVPGVTDVSGTIPAPGTSESRDASGSEPGDDPVTAAWCGLVAGATGTDDEDFFAAGGDSLRVVQLLERVRVDTGVVVPIGTFLADPTLGALRRQVAGLGSGVVAATVGRVESVGWECRVSPLGAGAGGPVFAVVPGGLGDLASLVPGSRLVRALGVPCTALGVHLEGAEEPGCRELVDAAVDGLVRVAGGREVVLFGHCLGGRFAWEIAAAMAARRMPVSRLILFDAPGPIGRWDRWLRGSPTGRRVAMLGWDLWTLPREQRREAWRGLRQRLVARVTGRVDAALADAHARQLGRIRGEGEPYIRTLSRMRPGGLDVPLSVGRSRDMSPRRVVRPWVRRAVGPARVAALATRYGTSTTDDLGVLAAWVDGELKSPPGSPDRP